MSSLLFLCVLLWSSVQVLYGAEEGSHSMSMAMEGCQGTPESLTAAINASIDYNLTVLVVNCLEYSDNRSTLSFGSLSFQTNDGRMGRYTVQCSNGLLLLRMSSHSYRVNESACYQCSDSEDPCVEGTECPSNCQYCLQSQCLHCTYAKYEGMCLPTASCPNGGNPNASNGNECECPGNFGGPNCEDCQISAPDCPRNYSFIESTCSCTRTCPMFRRLYDYNATVPASVIGSPNESGDSAHRKRTSHGESSSSSRTEAEHTVCVSECPNGWRVDDNGICYACGLTYCLECNSLAHCTRCRDGTLVQEEECEGFYDALRHLRDELEHEEEHEREVLDREKLELKIILPIVCFFAILVFIVFGIIAHFRYPHIGHEKRHRDPKKKITEDTIEHRFRPQSTVRFR